MTKGIRNFQIENAFKNINDEDINDIFVGIFPGNYMNKFIDCAAMISKKKGKFPFIIRNTDSSEKGGTHWLNILNVVEPK